MPFRMGEYQLYLYLPLLTLFPKRKSKSYPSAGGHIPKLATPELMWQIQDVIKDTVIPSWINSIPYNYGEAAASILKADKWRNMTTIYFPLALISMWGKGSIHQTALDAIKLHEILEHTMLLVSAILLVCMHTMTETQSKAYLDCMIQYISTLPKLANINPNHHMSMHVPLFMQLYGPKKSSLTSVVSRITITLEHLEWVPTMMVRRQATDHFLHSQHNLT